MSREGGKKGGKREQERAGQRVGVEKSAMRIVVNDRVQLNEGM